MSIIRCTTCDRSFDTDDQCGAIYYPIPKCEDCIQEEKERKAFKANPMMQWSRSYATG